MHEVREAWKEWSGVHPTIAAWLVVLGVVACVLVLFCAAERLLTETICGNAVISELPCPDGRLKAVLFSRDCGGAVDRGSYQVSVMNNEEKLSNADCGNVFISYEEPRVRWGSADTLVVTHGRDSKIFRNEREIRFFPFANVIHVRYELF
jgi:hypothetical protein